MSLGKVIELFHTFESHWGDSSLSLGMTGVLGEQGKRRRFAPANRLLFPA